LTLRVAANQSAHKKHSCAKQCKHSGLRRLRIIAMPATHISIYLANMDFFAIRGLMVLSFDRSFFGHGASCPIPSVAFLLTG
jgi:hypothetical protein